MRYINLLTYLFMTYAINGTEYSYQAAVGRCLAGMSPACSRGEFDRSFTVSWCHGVSLPLILAPIYSYAFILLLCYVPRGHCIVYSLVYRHCGMCRRQPGFLVLLSVDCVLCIQVTVQHGQNGGRTKEFQVSCLIQLEHDQSASYV